MREYCAPAGGAALVVDTAKYITNAMTADAFVKADDATSAFATGIAKGLETLVVYDGGAQVLNAAVTQALADKATGPFKVQTIPAAAATELAKKTPALVPLNAGAMAGRSIIKFTPEDDLDLVAGSMVGANSRLTGVLPQKNWTMDSGLKLLEKTSLPAFTLFKN